MDKQSGTTDDSLFVWADVLERASHFEKAWKTALAGGPRPRLEKALESVPASALPGLLRRLLSLEFAYRRRLGERPLPREYESRLPKYAQLIRSVLAPAAPVDEKARGRQAEVSSSGQSMPRMSAEQPETIEMAHPSATQPQTLPESEDAAPVHGGLPKIPGYTILGIVGRGGMGVVYKAKHLGLDRIVALKMLLFGLHSGPELRARFRREAKAVGRLRHPNFIQTYDFGEHDGLPFLCLEYVEGTTLQQRLSTEAISVREAARLTETIAQAMHYAHEQGIVHRDLKPANIILATDGRPRITDFGLARNLHKSESFSASGAVLGTPSYMAPEQAQGDKRQIGPATDVYAIGAMFYEMLTGTPPFHAHTPLETVIKVISDPPVPPRQLEANVPLPLQIICMKCLQKDPADRFPSAKALADELRRFLTPPRLSCPSCNRLFRTKTPVHAGQSIRCPRCKRAFKAPGG